MSLLYMQNRFFTKNQKKDKKGIDREGIGVI